MSFCHISVAAVFFIRNKSLVVVHTEIVDFGHTKCYAIINNPTTAVKLNLIYSRSGTHPVPRVHHNARDGSSCPQ